MTLLIFDCDGVLVETEWLATRCEWEAVLQLGYSISFDDYLHITLGKHIEEVNASLKKQNINLPPHFWDEMLIKQKELFEQKLIAVEGVDQTLASLTLPKCVASGSSMQRLYYTLGMTKLLPHFQEKIFSSDLVKRKKPFPDVYLYAAEQMGVNPKECLVVEDSLIGVEGAMAAGMTVLAFSGGKHITDAFRKKLHASGAHYVFNHMRELPALVAKIKV